MRARSYPSDLTDEQWALVRDLIPVHPGGRPRKTAMRDVLDAIFYVLRTGCQWEFLPRDFPPKSTVWGYFDEWRHSGALERIHDTLREVVRRPAAAKGFVLLPKRWVVERTFAWLKRCRRLSVDRERSVRSSEAMIRLAMIHLMLHRLCPPANAREFHYRSAA